MTDRVVAALQALVRIPTVSDRDPARVDGDVFDAPARRARGPVPAAPRAARPHPCRHPRAALPLGRCECRAAGGADGSPRRRARRHRGSLAARPVRRRDPRLPHGRRSGAAARSTTRAASPRSARPSSRCSRPATPPPRTSGCPSAATRRSAVRRRSRPSRCSATGGVTPWLVLDEGGAIAGGAFPGVKAPLGVIGVTEKGTTSLELVAEGRGGHASTPARNGPDRPHRARDPAGREVAVPRLRTGADARADATSRAARAAAAASAARARRPAGTGGHPRAARCRTRGRRHDAYDGRRHHPQRVAGPQRDRLDRQGRAQHPGDGGRHRRRASSSTSARRSTTTRSASTSSSRASRPRSRRWTSRSSCSRPASATSSPRPCRDALRDDGRHRLAALHRDQRARLPLRALPDEQGPAQSIHSFDEHIGVADLVDGARWYQLLIERLPA